MLSKAELKRLQSLARAKGRAETGLFLAEGVRLVEEVLASDIVLHQALITTSLEDTPRGKLLAERLRSSGLAVEVSVGELNSIAATESPQGVIAVARIPSRTLASIELENRSVLVVLDAVQDPGNFGTIVRAADAFGAAAVIALPGTVDPWNPKAVRSAAGSSLRVPIVESALELLVEYCELHEITLFGADGNGRRVEDVVVPPRAALVMGNEGAGLRVETRAACAENVAVPIRGGAESLNVGVAAGILLYLMSRDP